MLNETQLQDLRNNRLINQIRTNTISKRQLCIELAEWKDNLLGLHKYSQELFNRKEHCKNLAHDLKIFFPSLFRFGIIFL